MKTLVILMLLSTPAMAYQVNPQTGGIMPGDKTQLVGGKVIPDYGYGVEVGPQGQPIPRGGPDSLDREIARLKAIADQPHPGLRDATATER